MSPLRGFATVVARAEAASWRDLALSCAVIGSTSVLAALTGIYLLAFGIWVTGLSLVAFSSTRAASVVLAVLSPFVAVGSLDLGFKVLPIYVVLVAAVVGGVARREWRGARVALPDAALAGFLAVAVAVSVGNLGIAPRTTVVAAAGANALDVRSIAQLCGLLAMGAIYAVMRLAVRHRAEADAVVRALLVAAGMVAGYALYQVVGQLFDLPFTYVNERRPESSLPAATFTRINSTLSEPSPLAQFMAIPLLCSAAWLVSGTAASPSWMSRRACAAVMGGSLLVLVATLSKAGAAALAIWLPLTLFLAGRRSAVQARRAILVVALFVASLAILAGARGIDGDAINSERYVRVGYWTTAIRIAAEHPLGIGVGNFAFYFPAYAPLSDAYELETGISDAHSLVLESFAETGMVGGLLFCGFVFSVCALGLSSPRRDATAIALGGAFAVTSTMHLTYSFFYYPFEWVLAGVLVSLVASNEQVS